MHTCCKQFGGKNLVQIFSFLQPHLNVTNYLQEIPKSRYTTKLDESNDLTDNDELWKFLYFNIVPEFFQQSPPCPEHDFNCIFQTKDQKNLVLAGVNRLGLLPEDTHAIESSNNPINLNSPVLHQAVASAVSDGAIVSVVTC